MPVCLFSRRTLHDTLHAGHPRAFDTASRYAWERGAKRYDIHPANHHHRHGNPRHRPHTFPALPYLPGGEAHTGIHSIPWKSASRGGLWHVGRLLPEKRERFHRQPRHPRTACPRRCRPAPPLEAADASFHRRRHCLLYAACAVYFLKSAVCTIAGSTAGCIKTVKSSR